MYTPDSVATQMQLLHISHHSAHAHSANAEEHSADDSGIADQTFKLRLAAIFVILAAGLLGVIPPIIGSWLTGAPNGTTARLIRAASGGIILALSLIHIIPESFEQLEGQAGPIGGITVIAGLLAMLVLEYVATYVSVNRKHSSSHLLPTHTAAPAAAPPSPVHAHEPSESCNKLCKTSQSTPTSTPTAATATAGSTAGLKSEHCGHDTHHSHSSDQPHSVDLVPSLAHSHGCRQQPACHSADVKQQVVCVTMELGCVFHSVVLGLALGVMTDAPQLVLMLLVVLAVHQLVEGLALGAVLAATQRMARRKKFVLAVVYALTLPVGIAAGLLSSNSYDPTSPEATLVQGIVNGLSGGMLLYVSLFSLLAAELGQHDLLHRPLLAAGLMLAVVAGAAVMCVLGVWA